MTADVLTEKARRASAIEILRRTVLFGLDVILEANAQLAEADNDGLKQVINNLKTARDAAMEAIRQLAGMTYIISTDGKSITCLNCETTSTDPYDIDHRYCPCCKEFHKEASE